jgi:glycosyltransferase 2 family protein
MKYFRILGVLIGLSVAAFLIHKVGLASVRQSLGLLRWGYLFVILYPMSWMLLNTVGWWWAIHKPFQRIRLVRLAMIRLAGETFNSLLPSGYVGGEPLKAALLGRTIPLREATSSVLISKSAQSIAMILFVGVGLTAGKSTGPAVLHGPTLLALVLLSAGIALFTWLLAKRSFSRLARWIHGITGWPWLREQEPKLVALDESLGVFYRQGKGRFAMSIAWHMAGWIAGALEVAVIFMLLGHPLPLRQAWFIGAMGQLAAVAGMFVPAGVGLFEGAHYMAAAMLGLPPAVGLSVALIRRVREVFWDAVGVLLFWRLTRPASNGGGRAAGKDHGNIAKAAKV